MINVEKGTGSTDWMSFDRMHQLYEDRLDEVRLDEHRLDRNQLDDKIDRI